MKKFQVVLAAGVLLLAGCSTQAVAQDAPIVGTSSTTSAISPALRKLKIMGCCDSITVGNDGDSYRDELDALLRQVGVDATFVTAAVSSTPCSTWTPMLADLIKANRPDVLLLNCGTNDVVLTAAQLKAFGDTYARIINEARAAGVKIM